MNKMSHSHTGEFCRLVATLASTLIFLTGVIVYTDGAREADASPAEITPDFTRDLTDLYGPAIASVTSGDIIRFRHGMKNADESKYEPGLLRFVRWDSDFNMQVQIAGDLDPNHRITQKVIRETAHLMEVVKIGTPEHDKAEDEFAKKQASFNSPSTQVLAVRAKKK